VQYAYKYSDIMKEWNRRYVHAHGLIKSSHVLFPRIEEVIRCVSLSSEKCFGGATSLEKACVATFNSSEVLNNRLVKGISPV
jgi:hypothetical protein